MRAVDKLPEGYREIYSVNLQKDKKTALWVNVFSILFGIALAVPVHFAVPIKTLFSMRYGTGAYLLRFGALLVLMVAYMVLHELVHGVSMKLCGTKKIKYGYTGMYAFAGSDDYYGKKAYIFIALAPVAVWGIVLGVVNFLVPREWFWVIYLLQIVNLSGAAGDLFVTYKFSRMPKDILIRDSGLEMHVYSKEQE